MSGGGQPCKRKRGGVTLYGFSPPRKHRRALARRQLPQHRHMARLRPHPLEPGGDGREALELEAALVGDMRIGKERDFGDRIADVDEEILCLAVLLLYGYT